MQNLYLVKIMELIQLDGTSDTPDVKLDPDNRHVRLAGRSLPEDVSEFYSPILKWLDDYSKTTSDKTIVEFQLDYYSSATSKMLLAIFYKLEKLKENGTDVLVKWFFPEDDEDIQDSGEMYADIVDLPFEHIRYSV